VIYARSFFDLQLAFAESVAALSGLPLARTLLDFTNLYIRFGLGREFDPAHPTWQAYLAGLSGQNDRGEWTYRFYLKQPEVTPPPGVVATAGCFAYAPLDAGRIRLHFRNAEPDGRSPLGVERHEQRRAELTALFAHARRTLSGPVRVVGASWLYNLQAYRRLFPTSYLTTAHAIGKRFRHMPLWGQFLDRYGQVREPLARQFHERLRRQSTTDDLDRCFPLPVIAVEAAVQDFYEFYGV
jgi:hypothetical protein